MNRFRKYVLLLKMRNSAFCIALISGAIGFLFAFPSRSPRAIEESGNLVFLTAKYGMAFILLAAASFLVGLVVARKLKKLDQTGQ